AEHEVRRVEEEQDEERDELVRAPGPPDPPRGSRPDRAGDQRQRAEDDALVDRRVALEVGAGGARAQMRQGLPGAPTEARVRGQRNRDVDVEDLLGQSLVGVQRGVEEDQRDRAAEHDDGAPGERGQRDVAEAGGHRKPLESWQLDSLPWPTSGAPPSSSPSGSPSMPSSQEVSPPTTAAAGSTSRLATRSSAPSPRPPSRPSCSCTRSTRVTSRSRTSPTTRPASCRSPTPGPASGAARRARSCSGCSCSPRSARSPSR